MNILIVGASGATGRLLTEELLDRGHFVRAIVRSPGKLPAAVRNHDNLSVIQASVLDLSDAELAQHVRGCEAVASCLGHNVTLKGMYGHPRKLVTDATRRLCDAVRANRPAQSTKFVLMSTTGYRNSTIDDPLPFTQKLIVGLLRLVLPPHADNEQAAGYLVNKVGRNDKLIEWAAVRPDNLIDEDEVTPYDVYPSPLRSAIFGSGQTSRINVGHFMADLITEDDIWQQWQGQLPVIYNRDA
ncbi:MAG: SDR family oxidoreductase [Anaerolineae bacterium]|nr:SDR family oxidoreductase [Anaerolineae bacterium]MCB9133361.1 SDR family oxidoreductase [Anaerolineales bacterium]MCO5245683.1 SDR family oxidoreductase [Anaerolineae bacterium]